MTVAWRDWYARWERFQEAYVPERARQFELVADVAAFAAATGAPGFLDLCSGPGSVAYVVLDRVPSARVAAVDADPWLVEVGRRARPGAPIAWIEADVRAEGWENEAMAGGPFGVVAAATALHWLEREELQDLYGRVRSLMVDGGALVVIDALPRGGQAERAASLDRLFRWQARRASEHGEDWPSFWRAARAEEAFAGLLAAREARLGPRRPRVFASFEEHAADLLGCGFLRVGELWRRDAAAVLLAVT